jgi:hypothetical protein
LLHDWKIAIHMTGCIIPQKTEATLSLNKKKSSWQSNSYRVKILYSDKIKVLNF